MMSAFRNTSICFRPDIFIFNSQSLAVEITCDLISVLLLFFAQIINTDVATSVLIAADIDEIN